MKLPDVGREAILDALRHFDKDLRTEPEWADWELNFNYDWAVVENGQQYPVKLVVELATGVPRREFSGGPQANIYLRKRGFIVRAVRAPGPAWSISPGTIVKRTDVHRAYGGAGQGGIEPSRKSPNVFVFSDPTAGEQYGYTFDGWKDGLFHYTGDGQVGDQRWRDGNKAILEHEADGRDLRVFNGVRGDVTYMGQFTLDPTDPFYFAEAPDRLDQPRQLIVFRLRPVDAVQPQDAQPPLTPSPTLKVTTVPVEANSTESFLVSVEPREAEAVRREQALVHAYKTWIERRGSTITRLRCVPAGELHALYNDIFDEGRNNLIEAKGSATRASLRMAIGQLADYVRFAPTGVARAVLTEDRPRPDLEALLVGQGISSVWHVGSSFEDNADGRFT
jgi:hypothetical protein